MVSELYSTKSDPAAEFLALITTERDLLSWTKSISGSRLATESLLAMAVRGNWPKLRTTADWRIFKSLWTVQNKCLHYVAFLVYHHQVQMLKKQYFSFASQLNSFKLVKCAAGKMSQNLVKDSMPTKFPWRLRTFILQPYRKDNRIYSKRKGPFYKSCFKFSQQICTEGEFHNP